MIFVSLKLESKSGLTLVVTSAKCQGILRHGVHAIQELSLVILKFSSSQVYVMIAC